MGLILLFLSASNPSESILLSDNITLSPVFFSNITDGSIIPILSLTLSSQSVISRSTISCWLLFRTILFCVHNTEVLFPVLFDLQP